MTTKYYMCYLSILFQNYVSDTKLVSKDAKFNQTRMCVSSLLR